MRAPLGIDHDMGHERIGTRLREGQLDEPALRDPEAERLGTALAPRAGVEEVGALGPDGVELTADDVERRGPAGTRVEWDAQTTRAERPSLIAWRTEPESTVRHAGTVRFTPVDGGTEVTVDMSYDAIGAVGHAVAVMLGADPKRRMEEDLAGMKTFVEAGKAPSDATQPIAAS